MNGICVSRWYGTRRYHNMYNDDDWTHLHFFGVVTAAASDLLLTVSTSNVRKAIIVCNDFLQRFELLHIRTVDGKQGSQCLLVTINVQPKCRPVGRPLQGGRRRRWNHSSQEHRKGNDISSSWTTGSTCTTLLGGWVAAGTSAAAVVWWWRSAWCRRRIVIAVHVHCFDGLETSWMKSTQFERKWTLKRWLFRRIRMEERISIHCGKLAR